MEDIIEVVKLYKDGDQYKGIIKDNKRNGKGTLTKANGKTLLTAELANQFGFKEDYDTDGSINNARLEATKFFKETMNKPLTQYNLESSLPNYTDSNNEGFANIFPGAKKFL